MNNNHLFVLGVLAAALFVTQCKSSPAGQEAAGQDVSEAAANAVKQEYLAPAANLDPLANSYKGIPVEVTGLPYAFKDIRGNHTIDYLIDSEYELISTGQSSQFVDFKINKFVFDFKNDGSLVLSSNVSYFPCARFKTTAFRRSAFSLIISWKDDIIQER